MIRWRTALLTAGLACLATPLPTLAATTTQAPALPVQGAVAAPAPAPVPTPLPAPQPPRRPTAEQDEFSNVSVQVVAKISSTIGAPMGGRLDVFPLVDGDRFNQGDVLAKFHCDQQDAQLAHARSELVKRRGILDTNQKLRQLGTWSQNDFQTAAAEVNTANADVALTQEAVQNCIVKAPFTGRVAGVAAHNFQFVVPGAPLLEILDDRNLQLELVVPSRWLTWLAPGTLFTTHVTETGLDYPAEIARTSGRVDAVSRTIKVYGAIKGAPDRLLPGMSGTAAFAPPQ